MGNRSTVPVFECDGQRRILVARWRDPMIDSAGWHATSAYVEGVWLPVLGPTATWLLRRLVAVSTGTATFHEIDLAKLGQAVGLSFSSRRADRVLEAIGRLERFGVAVIDGTGVLRVRHYLPSIFSPLSDDPLLAPLGMEGV